MNVIWARSAAILISLLVLSAGVYLVTGPVPALALACVSLLGLLFYYLYQINRLWKVLDAPVYGEIPSALGLWGEVYYRLHRLVKRWRTQVLQVEQQHTRFIQAIQASPNGVLMLDDADQIEWCNDVAEQHFGLNARRDVRQRITHLIRRPEFVHYLTRQQFDDPLVMRDMGEHKHSVIAVQILPYGDNRKLVITQDITKLENTEAMRRDFVANVSHELKTPLTVMTGFLETVRDLPVSEEDRRRYIDMMLAQSVRMQSIVEDLLALAKLESDAQPPGHDVVPIRAMVAHLMHDAEALSQGRHHVSAEIDPTVAMRGAETELMSALGNLVSNAVRYTPEGGRITMRLAWEDGHAVFSVADTGLGIAAEHIPRLTERFYRVDRSRSRDTGGTGLGLAIVKHVLSRHHAELRVTSEEGRGSVFRVVFPLERSVRTAADSAEPTVPGAGPTLTPQSPDNSRRAA
ncbi:phosphate regulon sensor histidine kinase PhoR [Cupriavidus taiwanensis]|uniref:Phosphate regulon sensor protein PhoR n=2 Tax=Cupriavidus taiwanensis TaxID=164546 RepID=B3R1R2_CUPTR|nr:phosphate regulon sensor histidine kinase PhoR [Cupriavidus taiwanensis]CAQ69910.1 sensory histidine kinase in two-component regulatory system with PhoB [Cupriavidus taiwanensis LMG 19424]SOY88170.1 sensory histidine kinase in two-component regulatory system with PhoB [Cupriavidus taiwanensis]SOZ05814.1 sensory histidine kinase in two-component regulatory system with PhoB [Cupriavidus taiwanensis]SOZ07801.1 sensory histidine kinase in two-component regulatory system with PhoB [Cupriavidus ta